MFSCYVSLGSSGPWKLLRMSLFLIISTILKSTGQVVHRRSLDWDLPSVFLTMRLELQAFGRKNTERKCHSHHITHIKESYYTSNVIYQCCCCPRSPGWGSACQVSLVSELLSSRLSCCTFGKRWLCTAYTEGVEGYVPLLEGGVSTETTYYSSACLHYIFVPLFLLKYKWFTMLS